MKTVRCLILLPFRPLSSSNTTDVSTQSGLQNLYDSVAEWIGNGVHIGEEKEIRHHEEIRCMAKVGGVVHEDVVSVGVKHG